MIPKVAEDAPNRCQAVTSRGQCVNQCVEGTKYCSGHGGKIPNELRLYQVKKWQDRIDRLSTSNVKSLNEEIGVLRMSLETLLNRCEDDNDLIMNQASIAALVLSIEKVVSSCTKLEVRLGEYVEKKNLYQFAGEVIQLISTYVPEQELESIALKMAEGIEQSTKALPNVQ